MIFTVYNKKINSNIVRLQKAVFQKYNVDLNQIKIDNWVNHGESVDNILKEYNDPNEIIVLFDIDSIPLNKEIVPSAIEWAKNNTGIFSVAQRAVNIKNSKVHGGPAFMVFSIDTFNKLGRPSFTETYRSDCGGELTHLVRENNFELKLLYPSHVEKKTHVLEGDIMFGMGTTYENSIYHAFESRFTKNDHYFLNKCNSILSNL